MDTEVRTRPYVLTLIFVVLILVSIACGQTASTEEQVVVATATAAQEVTERPATVTPKEQASPTEVPTNTPEPSPTGTPTNTPEPTAIPMLGDIVENHGYFLSAITLEDPASRPGRFYEPEQGKKLVAVEFVLGNISGNPTSSNVLNTTLVDADGFTYVVELASVEEQFGLFDLGTGEKVRGWAGFIIPEDAKPASIKYEVGGSSGQTLQTGLLAPEGGQIETLSFPEYLPSPDLPSLGDVVENYGYSLSTITLEDPANNPGRFYTPQTGKKLIAVEFIVGNVSGEQTSTNVLNATLIDANGFLYEPELASVENQLDLVDINPSEKIIGWAGFMIPEDATPLILKYAFGGSSAKALMAGLYAK